MSNKRRLAVGVAAAATLLSIAGGAAPALADGSHGNQEHGNGTTTVVLNQDIVGALVGLGVAPVKPGTLSAPGGVYQVAFPITEVEDGVIGHRGGLDFSKAAAGNVKITSFDVDTNSLTLTAKTTVNGKRAGRIAVFQLGAVQPVSPGYTPACSGVAAGLTLTQGAAAALGVPAGLFVGDACVVPSADDDGDD